MKRAFGYLLVLLLASAALDDAWAAATPDLDDDVLAARNNEYLPAAGHAGCPRRHDGGRPPLANLPLLPVTAGDARTAPRARPRACADAGPPLVYLLMTLRR
jgi:hypothetical protein